MTQYNSVNVKVSNLQLNKLKSATKDSTGITLRLLSYMTDIYMIDKGNFLHKLLLTSRHVSIILMLLQITYCLYVIIKNKSF